MKRAKGEGSLLKIRTAPDPKTGERKESRFWYAQYFQNGRQIRVSTKEETKARALVVLRKLMGDADRGLAPITDLRKLSYGELRQGLLDNYVERGNKSLTTTASGEETINGLKQLDEFFGFSKDNPGPSAASITSNTSREFIRKRQKDGVGNAMINRSLSCLRRMLNIAHEDGKIQFVPKIRLLKEPPARKGFLEREKFEELVAFLPTHLKPYILFLYYCGGRRGEAEQIEWSQVDLDARLIRLEGEQTKNSEARTVPLPSELVMTLREITPKHGRVFDTTNRRVHWENACAACGLGTRTKMEPKTEDGFAWYSYKGLLIHDLRRSAVRNLVKAGVPERVAMKITGHKTRAVFDRYHIVSTEDVSDAMRKLELGPVSETSVKKPSRSVRRLAASSSK